MPKRKHHLTNKRKHSKMESMPADPPADPSGDSDNTQPIVTKVKRPSKILFWTIVGSLVILLTLAVLNYFHISPFPTKQSATSTKPTNPHALDTCDLTKEGNPLVEELSNQSGTIFGAFKGKISELEKDEVRQSVIFKLRSLDNTQQYKFNIRDKENFVINAQTNKIASMSALKKDQLIKISFVCNKENNLLDFTKISIQPASPSAKVKK